MTNFISFQHEAPPAANLAANDVLQEIFAKHLQAIDERLWQLIEDRQSLEGITLQRNVDATIILVDGRVDSTFKIGFVSKGL